MTENEAIEILKNNYPKTCKMVNGRLQGGFDDHECDVGIVIDLAIKALEEVQQYREIGTVEECRESVEKQTARKGIREEIKKGYNRGMHHYYCPVCYKKGDLSNKCNVGLYCSDCGQKLDWSDEK